MRAEPNGLGLSVRLCMWDCAEVWPLDEAEPNVKNGMWLRAACIDRVDMASCAPKYSWGGASAVSMVSAVARGSAVKAQDSVALRSPSLHSRLSISSRGSKSKYELADPISFHRLVTHLKKGTTCPLGIRLSKAQASK